MAGVAGLHHKPKEQLCSQSQLSTTFTTQTFFVSHFSCTGNQKFKHNSQALFSETGSQALLKPLLPLSQGRHCNSTSSSGFNPEQLKPMLPVSGCSPGSPPNYSLLNFFHSFSKLRDQTQSFSLLIQKKSLLLFQISCLITILVIISYLINHVWTAAMWDTVPSGFQAGFLPAVLTGRNGHVREVYQVVALLCKK